MNGIAAALAWSSITVTLVASTAVILERMASRCGPRAGAWVGATSLFVVFATTVLAFCPVPAFLTWRSRDSSGALGPAAPEASSHALREPARTNGSTEDFTSTAGPHGVRRLSWESLLERLGVGLERGTVALRRRSVALPAPWCAVVLVGATCNLLRLLFGLWGVRDCRRKSVAIDDPGVRALVDDLRTSLGVGRPVELRELTGLTTAAAVGWRYPLVLLPGDWRTWNDSERRAVLAHEVTHIARGDYAVGVIARLGLALHFYHPLVHWIHRRLLLQQELAADAEGARLAGGRRAYLLVLSRLALGMDARRLAWPGALFFSSRGHLIRRIDMLKKQSIVGNASITWWGRAITIALLMAIGLGAAALRGPSRIQGAEAPPSPGENDRSPAAGVAKTSSRRPFDLSWLPSKAAGFVAVKPAAIAQVPACKPQLARVNEFIRKAFPIGLPKIEEIEQVTFEFSVRARDSSQKQPGRLMTGACTFRTVEDFDWKTAIKTVFKKLEKIELELVEVHHDGKVYFKSNKPKFSKLGPDCFFLPDGRTLVWDFEENLRLLISQKKRTGPDFVAGDDWRKVGSGLIAGALDTRDQRWKLDLSTDEPNDLPIAPLLQQPGRWVLGIDGADALFLEAIATCDSDAKGQLVARTVDSLLRQARVEFGPQKTSVAKGDAAEMGAAITRLTGELVQSGIVHCDGTSVKINATSKTNVDSLMALMIAVLFG
jgi:beta-lactamase regulating signal transducer with metallopeptidase domain